MRFATYRVDGSPPRAGVVVDNAVHPLAARLSVLDIVCRGLPEALAIGADAVSGSEPVPLDRVALLAPLQPPTLRDFVAFEEHVEGVVRSVSGDATVVPEWYQAPTFYFTNPYAVIGPYDDVTIPPGCRQFDFELEVAAVAGCGGRDLTPAQARDAIFGYTVMNDWSARDLQRREMKVNLGPAKGKDSATTLGPWLVTADELEPFRDADGQLRLSLTVQVNGVEVGRDLLSNMGWPFEELVAYASVGAWVRPGDAFGSGTCGNGGCLAELWGRRGRLDPPPLSPGDRVTMTVQGIGTIANTVVAGPDAPVTAPARHRRRERPSAAQAFPEGDL